MPRADPGKTRFHRRLAIAALMAAALYTAALPAHVVASAPVFINEIHYRNAGPDRHEAVELAGIAGLSLAGWQLILYEGGGGRIYHRRELHGVIPDQQGGFGTLLFTYSSGELENDEPQGVALVDAGGRVVQLLSFGGTFTAAEGPARDLQSTDIGRSQGSETPLGQSLQLAGTGIHYADFRWQGPAPASYGVPNPEQRFGSGGASALSAAPEGRLSTRCPPELLTGAGIPAALTLGAVDADGEVRSARLKGVLVGGISLGAFRASAAPGKPASAVLLVAATVPAGVHRLEVEFVSHGARGVRSASCTLQVIVGAGPRTATEPDYRGTGGAGRSGSEDSVAPHHPDRAPATPLHRGPGGTRRGGSGPHRSDPPEALLHRSFGAEIPQQRPGRPGLRRLAPRTPVAPRPGPRRHRYPRTRHRSAQPARRRRQRGFLPRRA